MRLIKKYKIIKKICDIFIPIFIITTCGFFILGILIPNPNESFMLFTLLYALGCLIGYIYYSDIIRPKLNHAISYYKRKETPFGFDLSEMALMNQFDALNIELPSIRSGRMEIPSMDEPTFTSIDQLTPFGMIDGVNKKVSTPNKELKINDYITVKLENNETNVYVNDQKFRQCKYILLNILKTDVNSYDSIDSIDDVAEHLNHDLEGNNDNHEKYKITPEIEFFAHCSNLQSWCEYGYDTRILHSNLSFPLLKRLTEVGDPDAKRVLKEEIAKRYVEGGLKVRSYLNMENYLRFLDIEEIISILRTVLEKENEIHLQVRFDKNAYVNLDFDPNDSVFNENIVNSQLELQHDTPNLHIGEDWEIDDEEFDVLTIKERKKIDKLITKNKKILKKLDEKVKR